MREINHMKSREGQGQGQGRTRLREGRPADREDALCKESVVPASIVSARPFRARSDYGRARWVCGPAGTHFGDRGDRRAVVHLTREGVPLKGRGRMKREGVQGEGVSSSKKERGCYDTCPAHFVKKASLCASGVLMKSMEKLSACSRA